MTRSNDRAALLIIDLQEDFVTKDNRHVSYNATQLQTEFSHIYASKFIPDDCENERTGQKNLAFEPHRMAKIFEKSTYSAATPEVIQDLQRKGIDTVHICGLESNVCILSTAIALLDAGFDVIVRTEACASNSKKSDWDAERFHEAAMMIMKNMAIQIC